MSFDSLEPLDMALMTVQTARITYSTTICKHRIRKLVSGNKTKSGCVLFISSLAMFYIGSNVMDWPLEAARAVSDGLWAISSFCADILNLDVRP